jgi:hypothetical protein
MGIVSIIKEEISGFLNEKEYASEDIINPREINLQEEYDKLNKLLFSDSLSKVPLKWDTSKRRLGLVRSIHNRFTGERKVEYLSISNFYKLSYRQFRDTLAHEMVHVWQVLRGEQGNHQWSFLSEARRINGMNLGFNINVTNGEEIAVSDQSKVGAQGKTLMAIILHIDGTYYLNVTTPSTYQTESDKFFNTLENLVNRGRYRSVEVTVVESNDPELLKHRISRSYQKGFSYTPLGDNELTKLLDQKIVKNIKINRGVPMVVSEDALQNTSNEWEAEEIS